MKQQFRALIQRIVARATATGGREDGTVSAFVVIIALALLVLGGLVLDGGLALAGKTRASDEAAEAARAGAQALNIGGFRAGGTANLSLDPAKAVAAAQTYLSATGDTGTVSVTGATVTVTVTHVQPAQILSVVGVGSLTASATASATAETGG